MDKALKNAFDKYINLVEKRVKDIKEEPKLSNVGLLQSNFGINSLVHELEGSYFFNNFVVTVNKTFNDEMRSLDILKNGIGYFFKRSKLYLNIIKDLKVNRDEFLYKFVTAIKNENIIVNYYALLEYTQFDNNVLEFENFQITKFSKEELGEIFNSEVNGVFYPYAVINKDILKDYWFICTKEEVDRKTMTWQSLLNLEEFTKLRQKYTRYPQSIEEVLKKLVLFNWENIFEREEKEFREEKSWFGFDIPFFLKVDDNLFKTPFPSSYVNYNKLAREPLFDNLENEIGERPSVEFPFSSQETNDFSVVIKNISNLLKLLEDKPDTWKFIDHSIGYLVKAFFSTDLDQLLWHIIVLEALVGERADRFEGLSELISSRISYILGESESERKKIKKEFKKLYGLRSDLVHGRKIRDKEKIGSLYSARVLSRRCLIWFLNYLANIKDNCKGNLPERKQILSFIKSDVSERELYKNLLDCLPEDFPYIQNWLE